VVSDKAKIKDTPKAIKAAILPLLSKVEEAIVEESIVGKPKPMEKEAHRHRIIEVKLDGTILNVKSKVNDSIRPERSHRKYLSRICVNR